MYVAAKAEETAIHMKLVVTEARATFGGEYFATMFYPQPTDQDVWLIECLKEYGITTFPSDATKLAEMEFCKHTFDSPVQFLC